MQESQRKGKVNIMEIVLILILLYALGRKVVSRKGRRRKKGRRFPLVNGAPASKVQIKLAERVGGEVNAHIGPYYADVLITRGGLNIVIEYDSWKYHKYKIRKDRRRAQFFIDQGYAVIAVKSNSRLPRKDVMEDAIQKVLRGRDYVEVILGDWGKTS